MNYRMSFHVTGLACLDALLILDLLGALRLGLQHGMNGEGTTGLGTKAGCKVWGWSVSWVGGLRVGICFAR